MKRDRGNESESKNISKKHKNENECADGYKKWLFLDACRTGNLIIAKAMIQDGISANVAQKKEGDSAIHLAAKYGHVNIVQMLIDYEADVNAVKKEDKCTALHYAAAGGHVDVAKVLTQNGADVNAASKAKRRHFTSQLRKGMLTLRKF